MVSPRRLVHLFDFEETNDAGVKIGRGLAMPRNWYPVGRDPLAEDPNFLAIPLHQRLTDRPGYPPYGQVGFDTTQTASGDFALGLETQGGHTGAYLAVGALPALPDSDYLVTAKVKTQGLKHAGAVLVAYLIDEDGQRIADSVRHTRLLRDEKNQGWVAVDLKLRGRHQRAAFIGIEAHLVQPTPDPDHPLADQQVVVQDVEGRAWFDDIGVWQLPSIDLRTQSPVNLIRAPERPRIEAAVRDLAGRNLFARLTVYDMDRRKVDEQVQPIFPGSPASWQWEPNLPGYGWFLSELAVFDDPEGRLPYRTDAEALAKSGLNAAARSFGAFLHLPMHEPSEGDDVTRIGLDAQGVPEDELALLPDVVSTLGLRSLTVSAWDRHTKLADLPRRQAFLERVVERALTIGDDLTVSFDPVPQDLELSDGVNTHDPLVVFTRPVETWMPYVQPVLVTMGQLASAWQVGGEVSVSTTLEPDLLETLDEAHRAFGQWSPAPVFAMPGAINLPTAATARHVSHKRVWPMGVVPEDLGRYLESEDSAAAAPLTLQIETPRADRVPHRQRASDLARRMIAAWQLDDAVALSVGPRWTRGGSDRLTLLPDPLLGVYANVAERLIGRRIVGEIDLGPGVRCLVLQHGDQEEGSLIVWNDSRREEFAWLEMYLGDEPVAIDLWGNRHEPSRRGGKHRLDLTPDPVFIEGVNLSLALFRAGFGLDRAFIPSTQVPHQRTVRVTNPWPMTINGRFTVTGPGHWTINPQRQVFSLAPNASVDLPVAMSFPVSEAAGFKTFSARFEFQADREYVVDLTTPMAVGLENVRFEASLRLDKKSNPGQADLIATCIITNIGDEDLSLNVFASHVDHPYAERLIPRLEPGQAAIKNFRFPNAGAALVHTPVLCGVREVNGPAVLNRHLTLLNSK